MKFGINSMALHSPFDDPFGQFKLAKEYGFDMYEIAIEDWNTINADDIKKAMAETGIEVNTICGCFGDTRDVSSDDPTVRENGVKYINDMVDLAAEIGAEVVAGPIYSAVGKARMTTPEEKAQQWDWAVENLQKCADYAASKGIKLAIEPLNRFETDMINTAEQGLELQKRIGRDNVGFMLDTFHMNIEESNIPDAIRSVGDKNYTFHACAGNRGTPGEDNFDWQAIKKAFDDIGYDKYVVIESFTPDCVEIAKAASLWREFAPSSEYLCRNGVKFLRSVFDK